MNTHMRPALQQLRVGGCCGLIEESVRCSNTHACMSVRRTRACVHVCFCCVRACTCARARRRVHCARPWPIHGGIPSDKVAHPAWYPTWPGRYLSAEQYPALHGRRTNLFGEKRERDVREQHGQEREAQLRMHAVLWVLTWYPGYSDMILLSTHMRPTARRWNFSPSRAA